MKFQNIEELKNWLDIFNSAVSGKPFVNKQITVRSIENSSNFNTTPSKDKDDFDNQIPRIELLEHQHTLFCERFE